MKANVGIVTTWFERGAAYVSRQYRSALQRHYHVFIFARGGERSARGDPDWDGPDVTWDRNTTYPAYLDMFQEATFKKWLRENEIAVVLFNEQRWWPPVLWCKDLGVKVGAYVDWYTRETVHFFDNYDFLVCNTKRHHSVFQWHPQAFYVPWGTDINLFRPRSHQPVAEGVVTFFHSAGMDPTRKGTDIAIEALARLGHNARLVIHSQVDVRAHLPHLKSQIDGLCADGRLTLIQRTVAAPGLYYMGDVYVYPSRLDGLGLSVAEALSCGLPVIVSDSPPMNEFVSSDSGVAVPAKTVGTVAAGAYYWPRCQVDSSSLAAAMERYCAQYPELATAKATARRYAEGNLDWARNAEVLQKIVDGTRILPRGKSEHEVLQFEARRRKHWLYALYSFAPAWYGSARSMRNLLTGRFSAKKIY